MSLITMEVTSDEVLVREFLLDRDREALKNLVERYDRPVFAFLMRVLRDPHLAEEAAQDCFLRMLRGLQGYRSDLPFRPWLYRIALNSARTLAYREAEQGRRERLASADRREGDRVMNPAEGAIRKEVQQLVDDLPPVQKEALLLHYFQGLTHTEVASVLEVPAGTVATRIHGGLENLRNRLATLGISIPASGLGEFLSGGGLGEAPPSILSTVMAEATRNVVTSGAIAVAQGGLIMAQVKFSTMAAVAILFLVGGSVAGYGIRSMKERREEPLKRPLTKTDSNRVEAPREETESARGVLPTGKPVVSARDTSKRPPAAAPAPESREAKIRRIAAMVARMLRKTMEPGVKQDALLQDPELLQDIISLQNDPEAKDMLQNGGAHTAEFLTALFAEFGAPLKGDQLARFESVMAENERYMESLKGQNLSGVDRMLLEIQSSKDMFSQIKGIATAEQMDVFARFNRFDGGSVPAVMIQGTSPEEMASAVLDSWSKNIVPLSEQDRQQLSASAANYAARLQSMQSSMEAQYGTEFMKSLANRENPQASTPPNEAASRLEKSFGAYEQFMLFEKEQRQALMSQLPAKADTIRGTNPFITLITTK